jgi:hypothetical protein
MDFLVLHTDIFADAAEISYGNIFPKLSIISDITKPNLYKITKRNI